MSVDSAQTAQLPSGAGRQATGWHRMTPEEVGRLLEVDLDQGLSSGVHERRLQEHGPNALEEGSRDPLWRRLLRQYESVMQWLLVAAAILSLVIGQLSTGALLLVLTLVNAYLGLSQEAKAERGAAALSQMMKSTARVRRDGKLLEVATEGIVPGDLVLVEAGDRVPADGRLIQAAALEIEESALTGESQPAAKDTDTVDGDVPLGDRSDMGYMNTLVTRGSGTLIVTTTGMDTEVGRIADLLESVKVTKSPLQRQMDDLAARLGYLAIAAIAAIIISGLARGLALEDLFLLAVAIAVAALPTGLPTVVTTLLSLGTQELARENAILKDISSVETLGSTSAICSDKTGTLTLNQMTAREMLYAGNRYRITGSGYSSEGHLERTGDHDALLDPALLAMSLASDASVRDGELVGDPTEGALVTLAAKGGLDVEGERERRPRAGLVPFDSTYKLMASFHDAAGADGAPIVRCFVKGAPTALLDRAATVSFLDGQAMPIADARRLVMDANARMAEHGLRVLLVGARDFSPDEIDLSADDLLPAVEGIDVLALVAIVDPPRPEAKDAIAVARKAGIRVRMITGDHAVTASAIGHELGIEGEAISGTDLDQMDDATFSKRLDAIGVIGRVAPEHKVRLVETLERNGEIVGMTGDGVNDAPALKAADIGIAMGITGSEVSKQASRMILADDNFATIIRAVERGRAIYDNLEKYLRFQLTALLAYLLFFTVAAFSGIGDGAPLSPLQILFLNFAVAVPFALALGLDRESPGLMDRLPRDATGSVLNRRALMMLAIPAAATAAAAMLVVGLAPGELVPNTASVAGTMGVVTIALSFFVIAIESRSETLSVFQTGLDAPFVKRLALGLGATVAVVVFDFLNRWFDTVPLTGREWGISIAAAAGVFLVMEAQKLVLRMGWLAHAPTA